MKNFLEDNQKKEIRCKIDENIILYEPNDLQIEEIKNIIKDVEESENKGQVEISIKYMRYIIRELIKDGVFVDEYSDDELISLLENGNIKIKKMNNAIADLLSEISEIMLMEQSNLIKTYTQMVTILNSNIEMNEMKNKFNKLLKKKGYNVKFEDVLEGKITPDMLTQKQSKKKKK